MATQNFHRAVVVLLMISTLGIAQTTKSDSFKLTRNANGFQVASGGISLEVRALREDVVRVRVGVNGAFPEDASWAVLANSRQSTASVVNEENSDSVGFHTQQLRVKVSRKDLQLSVTDLQGNVLQEDVPGWPISYHGAAFRIFKKMPGDEHYFGLGDKVGPLDRRDQAFTQWNTDAYEYQESTDPIYKSIPFFIAARAGRYAGIFFDNTWRSSFDFGKQEYGIYSFSASGGPIDYYVMYGPNPKHVVETYAWLTGTTPLPPLWSFGFQQSRYSYETEARLREVAAKYRADKIPADVLYMDIDYQQENRPFTVDPQKYPHFTEMLRDLRAQHFRVVTITDLHIAHVPGGGYEPFTSGAAGDHFVKKADGSLYVGIVWPGPSVFPEFTRQSTREWWGKLYSQFVADGVSGFWNDMNEPALFQVPSKTMPLDNQHRIDEPGFAKRTASHLEIHNVLGMENSRATYEGLLKISPNTRPFVLTRASYAGGQRYASTWTGDNSSTWNHLRLTTPMLLNLSLSGFGMVGADVGGFAGSPQPDLLTKWIEVATFHPIDRDHTTKGTLDQEPWVHGPEHEAIRKRYIEERYRLMPYLYTAAEEMSRTGIPIMRPLFLEFPNATADKHPIDVDAGNQFLFGADILVAPNRFPEELDSYDITFPPGSWYDYWTGEAVSGPTKIKPTLEVLPVYVRAGAIIPIQPLVQSTEETPQGPLTLRVYPGPDCKGSVYLDDGVSLDYQKGKYLRTSFSCTATNDGLKLHIAKSEGSFTPWWSRYQIEVVGWQANVKPTVLLNGKSDSSTTTSVARNVLTLDIPATGEINLEIPSHP